MMSLRLTIPAGMVQMLLRYVISLDTLDTPCNCPFGRFKMMVLPRGYLGLERVLRLQMNSHHSGLPTYAKTGN